MATRKFTLSSFVKLARRLNQWTVRQPDPPGCWLWTGSRDLDGYGSLSIKGQRYAAHRLSYRLYVGHIPPRRLICHTCDQPACVFPPHLFVGSHRENALDAVRKGRWKGWPTGVPNHGAPHLSDDTVLEIRRLAATGTAQRALAQQFHVRQSIIRAILRGRTYRWVSPVAFSTA
jgi:hypothetical protein